jgi:taurine transport system permease protein
VLEERRAVDAALDTLRAVLDPFIEFYRPLPPLAYLPLVIIWFGIGETSATRTRLMATCSRSGAPSMRPSTASAKALSTLSGSPPA